MPGPQVPGAWKLDAGKLEEAAGLLASRFSQGRAPSLSVGVSLSGRMIHHFGFGGVLGPGSGGNSDRTGAGLLRIPPGQHTAYRIASCTKSFTAAAVLLLRDRGSLVLDEQVTGYVPSLRLDGPPPTLRMLLSMSAGLPTDDPWADRQESLTREQFDAVLAGGVRLVHQPGTAYEYSNLGYALLGRVVEVASGRPYREFVTEELLEPLGLGATGFDETVPAEGGVATGFRRSPEGWQPLRNSGPGAFSPIGGLFSTAADLSRWAGWLLDAFDDDGRRSGDVAGREGSGYGGREPGGREPGDGGDRAPSAGPLSAATRREMQQVHRLAEPAAAAGTVVGGYGFGLRVEQSPRLGTVVFHSGGYPGFSSHMRWHPASGVAVVGFENGTYAGTQRPVQETFEILLSDWSAPGAAPWPETLQAMADVNSLLDCWDDALLERICSGNVALDQPLPERRAALEAVLASTGRLQDHSEIEPHGVSPARLQWTRRGPRGGVRCEILMAPVEPVLIQTLKISPVP